MRLTDFNFDVRGVMNKASDYAPFALLLMAAGTFLIVGTFWQDYYSHIFSPRFPAGAAVMAFFVALIKEGVRLALLISSIRDFSDNRKGNGWIGLIASVALVWYEVKTSTAIAELWAAGGAASVDTYRYLIIFLVALGLVLELRLILTIPESSFAGPQQSTPGKGLRGSTPTPTPTPPRRAKSPDEGFNWQAYPEGPDFEIELPSLNGSHPGN